MALRLNGSSSGYVELDVPADAGSHTLTLPDGGGSSGQYLQTNGSGALSWQTVTSGLPATAPLFRATVGTAQGISHNSDTKIQFDTENFDTNNVFDNTTNYRFTPDVAGYYQVNLFVDSQVTSGRTYYFSITIKKNGSAWGNLEFGNTGTGGGREGLAMSDIVYLNGSTDYIEAYYYHYDYSSNASTIVTVQSKFSAALVRT
jgi:hypothetical protein